MPLKFIRRLANKISGGDDKSAPSEKRQPAKADSGSGPRPENKTNSEPRPSVPRKKGSSSRSRGQGRSNASPGARKPERESSGEEPGGSGRSGSRGGRGRRRSSSRGGSKSSRANRPPARQADPPRQAAAAHEGWSLDQFQVAPKEGETRFHDLGLPDELMHAVHDLGFTYCTPIQSKVLKHVTPDRNVAGRAQTGTGKTAAFLIATFADFLRKGSDERPKPGCPRCLVLGPTRELVIQIASDAETLGKYTPFRSLAVYGGMDYNRQQDILRSEPVDILAATPGRLLDFQRQGIVDLSRVEVLVIDEADRMLDMGFIPDVRRIIQKTPPKNRRRTMLFSATLTETVLRLAAQWMPDPMICEIEPEKVTVDTVRQLVYAVPSEDKFSLLYNLLTIREMKRVLVFGNRRLTTERLANELTHQGISCELLSGAVAQKKRLNILEDFRAGKIPVVVATDVAGRGLHVDDIDYVINFDFPYEAEDYVHRIGRTGRAGVEGTAISFACEEESFIIPDIEKYIGQTLPCEVPEQELLKPPPKALQTRRGRPTRSSRPGSGGRSGGGRGGGGRRSSSGGPRRGSRR